MRKYFLDEQRIAESLWSRFGRRGLIKDKASFDIAYDEYMAGTGENLREGTFVNIRKLHPEVEKGSIIEQAKGKDLEVDRQRTSKNIVTTKKEYIRRGATNVDLKGYDTRKEKLDMSGEIRGRIVKAKRVEFIVHGKKRVRFRDSKGRFVKTK